MRLNTRTWVLVLASIASLMVALHTLVVSTALNTIREDLAASVAVLAGPTLGGAVAEGLSWEWVFWLNVPIGVVLVPLVLTRIEALAGGLLLVTAFVAWEYRTAAPMLPLRMFRLPGFSAGNVAVFCLFGSIFAGVFFFAQFMQVGLGHDALEAGLSLLPWTAPLFLVAPAASALADRVGDRPVLIAGMATLAAGMCWVAVIAEPGMGYGELVVPPLVAGLGAAMAIPPAAGAVLRAVPAHAVGPAAALALSGAVAGLALPGRNHAAPAVA
ncbi:MFS transporter [Solirubrobacter sp. CPCC 204708]|uniref:MFS transporter n=1 Tax=Solirubrobacter deserti TaxID=2282478 RepID=A0ABT4RQL9_9ACTN|nr:MFS transporter [Solirubrobacter deserti]MBE2320565.1 MFS transporter [Solirubrobacter deserti]MDA0140806.1 MFS transporter [Solirubrobacter deserti]